MIQESAPIDNSTPEHWDPVSLEAGWRGEYDFGAKEQIWEPIKRYFPKE